MELGRKKGVVGREQPVQSLEAENMVYWREGGRGETFEGSLARPGRQWLLPSNIRMAMQVWHEWLLVLRDLYLHDPAPHFCPGLNTPCLWPVESLGGPRFGQQLCRPSVQENLRSNC